MHKFQNLGQSCLVQFRCAGLFLFKILVIRKNSFVCDVDSDPEPL